MMNGGEAEAIQAEGGGGRALGIRYTHQNTWNSTYVC